MLVWIGWFLMVGMVMGCKVLGVMDSLYVLGSFSVLMIVGLVLVVKEFELGGVVNWDGVMIGYGFLGLLFRVKCKVKVFIGYFWVGFIVIVFGKIKNGELVFGDLGDYLFMFVVGGIVFSWCVVGWELGLVGIVLVVVLWVVGCGWCGVWNWWWGDYELGKL